MWVREGKKGGGNKNHISQMERPEAAEKDEGNKAPVEVEKDSRKHKVDDK